MTLDSIFSLLGNIPFFFGAIFGLGFSIFVHELGHFLAARKRGLQVTRFSIGMGPRLFSWTKDGVEYRISALPIGGYVALPQLADMGRLEGGTEGEEEEVEALPPISFTDKVIVSVMGAIFNFIFAFLLALFIWWTGQPSDSEMLTTEIGYVSESLFIENETIPGPAAVAGLKPGDIILEVDGSKVETFSDIQKTIVTSHGRDEENLPLISLKISRDGVKQTIAVRPAIGYMNSASKDPFRTIGVLPARLVKVHDVSKDSPAEAAGLQQGDIIVSANGEPIRRLRSFSEIIATRKGMTTEMVIDRDGEQTTLELNPSTVAWTKPLVIVTLQRSGQESTFSIRPDFPENSTELKTELTSTASLYVHQISSNNGGSLDKVRQEDRIIAINNKAVNSLQDALDALATVNGPVMQLTIGRGENTQTQPVVFNELSTSTKEPMTQPMVGIITARETVITHMGPFKQFGQQIDITFRILGALFHRGSEIGIGHLSGPIGIVRQLTEFTKMDFRLAISFLILMNVNLGILNLLPIPILDGGHILFAVIGKIRRKALPVRFVASLQGAFMLMLLALFAFILFKDSLRWQGDARAVDENELMSKLIIDPVFVTPEKETE